MVRKSQTFSENEDNPQTPEKTGPEGQLEETPEAGEGLTPEQRKIKELESQVQERDKKLSDSARGVQDLLERQKKLEAKLEESNEALSEKELLTKNPEYEFMDEDEKKRFKTDMEREKRIRALEAKEKMREDYNALPEETRKKIGLKGGFDVFRDFACSPDNAGQKNLLNVAKSFLYEEKEETPEVEEKPRPGLEGGTGGERTPQPKKEGFTAAELKHIREKEPDRYAQLAREHKLKIK